jgi:hypothetical protein
MNRLVSWVMVMCPTLVLAQAEVQLLRESTCVSLLGERSDYEASGVALKDGQLYVVFDDDGRIARVDPELSQAELLGSKDAGTEYEGITWDPLRERFYVVVEAQRSAGGARPGLVELDADLQILARHEVPFDLDRPNKGGEGVVWLEHQGESRVLVLLEGNHGKGGKRGKDVGHGLALVYRFGAEGLEQLAELKLPAVAAFEDYSGIAIREGRLAVVSQSTAQLWVGELDPDTWSVTEGRVYDFPRQEGEVAYGNIEGVVWLDDQTLACVSDQPKPNHPEHRPKGESVHVFRLPVE